MWVFRLLALSAPLLVLALIEIGLRLLGVGYPTNFLVPHPTKVGYVTDNYKFAWRFFPKQLARSPQPVVVQQTKPIQTRRIVVFGGSAAMGDPEPAYGMPRLLEVLLEKRVPGTDFEVVNCAVTAINSHVVRSIARDCRQLNADAWIVYLGNNEVHGPFGAGTVFGAKNRPLWLTRASLEFQRTKIGQLSTSLRGGGNVPQEWGGMEMFLQQQIRHDDPQLDQVYQSLQTNLRSICRSGGRTPLLICSVVTNERDFAPFVSAHRLGMTDEELDQWTAAFTEGCEAQHADDHDRALLAFARAREIDPDYAELAFREAQSLLATAGDAELTRRKFKLARDHDALRFRADSHINQRIERSATASGATFVDVATELAKSSPFGIVGDNYLHEHVHFNFAGNYEFAKLLGERLLREVGWESVLDDATETWPSMSECAAELVLSPYHQRLTLEDVLGRLQAPPFDDQFNQAVRIDRVKTEMVRLSQGMTRSVAQSYIEQFKEVLQRKPQDWVLRRQFGALLNSLGQRAEAAEEFRSVVEAFPHHAESQFLLGAQLNRAKEYQAAETALRKALELRPDFARSMNSLGISLSHQGEIEASYDMFRAATELRPQFAEAFVNWGLVLANQGESEAAMEKYRAALAAVPDHLPAHRQLARSLSLAKDFAAALPHLEAVVDRLPNDAIAHFDLGTAYLSLDQRELARTHLQRAVALDPRNTVAQRALQTLDANP